MKVIEIEGKSVEDAKKKAAELYSIDFSVLNDEDVEILDEGKSGIFGFGVSRPAKIRVSYNDNKVDIGDKVKEVLSGILSRMEISYTIREFHESENKVYIDLESASSGLLIGKKGATLESIQLLLNLMVGHETKSDKKIIIDIETYRAKREKALKNLSRSIASRVARTGKPWTLEPMNPFERRLVHLTLQNDKRVITKSEGEGANRKVKVLPNKSSS